MQDPLFQTLAFLAITIYIALGIHVLEQQPGRLINRVFAFFCISVALYYFTSLFLYPTPTFSPDETPLALRIKAVAILLCPTLFYHLMSFYFPEGARKWLSWIPWAGYGIAIFFSLSALLTPWLVAGVVLRGPNEYMLAKPGPLFPLARVFMMAGIIGGPLGLAFAVIRTKVSVIRRQLYNVLIPTLLILIGSIIFGMILPVIENDDNGYLTVDILTIVGAFLFTRAVLRYGYFVGRPLSSVRVVHGMVSTFGALAMLFPAVFFDMAQIEAGIYPYPLVTGTLIIIIGASMTSLQKRVMPALDRFLFSSERRQQMSMGADGNGAVGNIDPQHLQADLLAILCGSLRVKGGYLAASPPGAAGELEVYLVNGGLSISPGSTVTSPAILHREPRLASALQLDEIEAAGWTEITVFCSLVFHDGSTGLMALGEKRDHGPFSQTELALCNTLARQIEDAVNLAHLREEQHHQIEAVRAQTAAISRLEEAVIASTMEVLANLDTLSTSLEIRILGPLQVRVNGEQVPEAAWGTERAKALLAFLLWKGPDGATRDEITWLLWPDHEGERAANVFHVTVNRLRKVLEPHRLKPRDSQYILHEGGRYRFNFSAPHWMDWSAFQQLAASNDISELAQAASLYRGPLLEDAAWALPPDVEVDRRILEQKYVSVLRRLANGIEGENVEIVLRKILAVEPADENAHRALVNYYQNCGRPDLAAQHIQRWQAEFARLGLAPAPENAALWKNAETRRAS